MIDIPISYAALQCVESFYFADMVHRNKAYADLSVAVRFNLTIRRLSTDVSGEMDSILIHRTKGKFAKTVVPEFGTHTTFTNLCRSQRAEPGAPDVVGFLTLLMM